MAHLQPSLQVLIVDDEPPARARARQMLLKIGGLEIIGEAKTGKEALDIIESQEPDVVLLDIQMPDLDGLRVIEALDDPPAIIFSTAFDQYAIRAFELEAVDYLLKPYSLDRLRKAIYRVRRLLSVSGETQEIPSTPIRIPALNGLATELIPTEKILFFQIMEGVVFLMHESGDTLICNKTLNELEEVLPPQAFFRANRQAIINLKSIQSYTPTQEGGLCLQFKGERTQVVSRRRTRHLKSRLEKMNLRY